MTIYKKRYRVCKIDIYNFKIKIKMIGKCMIIINNKKLMKFKI